MKRNLLFFALFAFCTGTRSFGQEILLPDQIFTIKVTEKNVSGKTESMPMDELVMKANQISTTFSLKNAFPKVTYTVTQDAAPNTTTLLFTAESTNSNKDILKWSGTIKGNKVEGKAERIHNGKSAGEYAFSGLLKTKK